jgi:mediator of RNA polymerase II transcription subunit 16
MFRTKVTTGKFSSAIAALTLAFSRGCGADVNTDDILMVALRQLSAGQFPCQNIFTAQTMTDITTDGQATLITETFRALPVNCNFTIDQEKLMTHPYIPKCLSLQAALGYSGRLKRRSLASSVPWAVIQLRHASVLFAFFFQHTKGSPNEAYDPGTLLSRFSVNITR